MKHLKKALLFICIINIMVSCTNSDDFYEKNSLSDFDQKEMFTLTVKYKGLTYVVPCMRCNDSLVYLDNKFNELYSNEISKLPELATLVYKDASNKDVIEYYSTDKELETKNGITYFNDKVNDKVNSRTTAMPLPDAGRAIMYDDSNFKDRTVVVDINYDIYWTINNLKGYADFNDKTSAIRVFNFLNPSKYYSPSYLSPNYSESGNNLRTCLIGYEDSNFTGKKLYCIATYSNTEDIKNPSTATHQDYKLGNIGWNDKISSVVFRIITVDNIASGIYTPHNPI